MFDSSLVKRLKYSVGMIYQTCVGKDGVNKRFELNKSRDQNASFYLVSILTTFK